MLNFILRTIFSGLKSRKVLVLENLALRHQLIVLQRNARKPGLTKRDRLFWTLLLLIWTDWRKPLVLVKPETVILWHRRGFYGADFRRRVGSIGIEQLVTAARSPWQNPYAERVIGSIRRECLDHVIVFNERHLRRVLTQYFHYYHNYRTHLGLEKDCPFRRRVERPETGRVKAEPTVGGLHHLYFRQAA